MSEQTTVFFKTEELRDARTTVWTEELKTLKSSSRRAANPAERVALAELEKRLRDDYAAMEQQGLVSPLPEGLAA